MRETNTKFAEGRIFIKACELAELPATSRQASKYRRGLGLALRQKRRAFTLVAQERIREIFSKGESHAYK